jgi:hypothetical protein
MKRHGLIAVAALILSAPLAFAQSDEGNKAVNKPGENNPGAPAAGANSFTEGQARSRIESSGFTAVTGLTKDTNGIWKGTATKDGKQQSVNLDFQGNVVATPQ